jgi:hypothetical protein
MVEKKGHNAFKLKDFFHIDPIREISSTRSEDTDLTNSYGAYREYLQSVSIVWQRIRVECKDIGAIHAHLHKIETDPSRDEEFHSLMIKEHGIMNVFQRDIETFVLFARIFMDKIGQIIEKLIVLPRGKQPGKSFTDHKKYFDVYHPRVHPEYSNLLQNKTHWYEQELLLLKDKIFAHGKPLITQAVVSSESGVRFTRRRMAGGSPLKDHHKKKLLPIIAKYEHIHPSLMVTRNEYGMLDDFLLQIRKHDYKLDKADLNVIGNIVTETGASFDQRLLESIAMHIEDFLNQVRVIFYTAQ